MKEPSLPRTKAKGVIEGVAWAITFACAGYLLLIAAQAQIYDHRAQNLRREEFSQGKPKSGALIGRVDIPRLHLSVPVLEDDAAQSLLLGLGHIPGTAELGGLGTVGLAGHRDTFLKPLRGIAPGMEIRVIGSAGVYHYVVDSSEVVMPQAVSVVATHSRPELTLITCYPFTFVGPAPKRFVVHAHLLSVLPD
jgi:sortase A